MMYSASVMRIHFRNVAIVLGDNQTVGTTKTLLFVVRGQACACAKHDVPTASLHGQANASNAILPAVNVVLGLNCA